MSNKAVIDQLLADVRMQFKHTRECSGTRKRNGTTIPCPSCEHGIYLFKMVPAHLLSQILTEPVYGARVQMLTLLVDSTFNRGTHTSKRSQADKAVGMRLLKDYQDSGGKLRTSTPLDL